jgi:carbon storage regulator CsrA
MSLSLSRRTGQRIMIGDNITILVTRVEAGEVRMSIECPRTIPILRGETLNTPAGLGIIERAKQHAKGANAKSTEYPAKPDQSGPDVADESRGA